MKQERCSTAMNRKRGKQSPKSALRCGFTLIEILVVLAIIMLLAGILFPVFGRARENSRRTACTSNLKQISMASQLYLQDNDRRYPPYPTVDDGNNGWAWELRNLMKSDQTFQCPSEPFTADEADSDGVLIGGFTDYWMNYNLEGMFEGRLQFPTNTILLGDGKGDAISYSLPSPPEAFGPWDPDADYAQRHFDGSNYAFADGHVKWLKPTQLSLTAAPSGSNFTFVP